MSNGLSVIHIEMPDDSKFQISSYLVAFNRAVYYANIDIGHKDEENLPYYNPVWCNSFAEEFYIGLRNIDDLRDWILNNMNWYELDAKMIKEPDNKPDYSKMLSEAEFKLKVVEK